MFICAICGRFLRTLTYVGDSLCCLRFILPRIPQIFTDFIYSNIRASLCYLWETPSHPISVFICAICGRFLRTLTSVGDSFCSLRFILPQIPQIFTDFIYPRIRVHPRYLWKTSPHPISVLICDICVSHHLQLEIYSPTDSTDIHKFYISYVLSVRDSFLRCICGNLTKSIAIDFSNDTIINVICIEINKDTDMLFGEAKISKQLLMMYWF